MVHVKKLFDGNLAIFDYTEGENIELNFYSIEHLKSHCRRIKKRLCNVFENMEEYTPDNE